jgi:hypothetical protein
MVLSGLPVATRASKSDDGLVAALKSRWPHLFRPMERDLDQLAVGTW